MFSLVPISIPSSLDLGYVRGSIPQARFSQIERIK